RIRLARGHLQLDVSDYLPCHRELSPTPKGVLCLLHLPEIELHRGRSAKNLHRDPDLVLLVVDVLDDAVEIVEWAVSDAYDLARLEQNLRPRLVDALLNAVQYRQRFPLTDRRRPVAAAADEPQDLRHLL